MDTNHQYNNKKKKKPKEAAHEDEDPTLAKLRASSLIFI